MKVTQRQLQTIRYLVKRYEFIITEDCIVALDSKNANLIFSCTFS